MSVLMDRGERARRWTIQLAVVAVFLAAPALTYGQSSRVRTATVRFQGGQGQDGYEWATYSARYAFHACGGEIGVTVEFVRGSLQFSPSYILDGHEVQAPANLAPSEDQAGIAGDVTLPGGAAIIGSFRTTAGTITGHDCLGYVITIAKTRDHLGENPLPPKVREFIDGLELSVKMMPPYLNRYVESAVRDKADKERRQVARKAAEDKAAVDKAAVDKATGDKAAGPKAAEQKREGRLVDKQPPAAAQGPTGTEQWNQYLATEANREERNRDVGDKFAADFAALGAQIGKRSAKEEAREAREDARSAQAMIDSAQRWRKTCAARTFVEIADTSFHLGGRTMFTAESRYCWNGESLPSSNYLSRDLYGFTVSSPQRLRFVLGGQPDTTVLVAHSGVVETLGDGRDFTIQLQPGRYTVVVSHKNEVLGWPDEPYYLRIMKEGGCWTDNAVPVVAGVKRGVPGNGRCVGPGGHVAEMYSLAKPDGEALRNLHFELTWPGAAPQIMLLAGTEGRRVVAEYQKTADSISVDVKGARPDAYHLLVAAGRPGGSDELQVRVQSETLPYRSHFRGDFTLGFGWQGAPFGSGGEGAALLKIGFSLGMQVARLFGVSGVVNAGLGWGQEPAKTSLGFDVHESVLAVPVLLGVGLHFGTPSLFVRLTPAVSVVRWDGDTRVGKALRLDAVPGLFRPGGNWSMLPNVVMLSHSGVTTYGFGIDFVYLSAPPHAPPPDDV